MTDFTKLKESLPPDPLIADGAEVRISAAVGSFWLATCSTETVARAIAAIPEMLAEIERLNAGWHKANCDALDAGLEKKTEIDRLRALVDSECRRAEDAHGMSLRQSLMIEKMQEALRKACGALEMHEHNSGDADICTACAAYDEARAILGETEKP